MLQGQKITRRGFILGGMIAGGAWIVKTLPVYARQSRLVPVPPALMLHSGNGYDMSRAGFLPVLVRSLKEEGYATLTYKGWWDAVVNGQPLPEKPLIISIDDLTMVHGNPSFSEFQNMHDYLLENGYVAVFGIITRPRLAQDETRWERIASWVDEGFELATHTSEHSNFNRRNGQPREDFSQEDYDAEIIDSAEFIFERTAQPVTALITPYGSGFDRSTGEIHGRVANACRQTSIKFVVGINDGRAPLPHTLFSDPQSLIYLGRGTPHPTPESKIGSAKDAMFGINYWYQSYRQQRETSGSG